MIELQPMNRAALEEFIRSEAFTTLRNLPISRHRARSQLLNPRAEPGDTLLILAYEQGELVGYVGILPDCIHAPSEPPLRFGWLSCIWVDPAQRGRNIGSQLLQKALEAYRGRLIGADYDPGSLRLYQKAEVFAAPWAREGIRLYLRMDLHTILPPKNPWFRRMAPLLRMADLAMNAVLSLRDGLPRPRESLLRAESVLAVDEEADALISGFQDASLFRRGARELNWILHHPWILSGSPDGDSRRYYFSSVDRSFSFHGVKLRDAGNRLVAFLVFSQRNGTLKLPYCFMAQGFIDPVARYIESFIAASRATSFTTFHPALTAYFSSHQTPGLFKKRVARRYMVTRDLTGYLQLPDRCLQDGDGDCAFT